MLLQRRQGFGAIAGFQIGKADLLKHIHRGHAR